jgi:hypothetical protein
MFSSKWKYIAHETVIGTGRLPIDILGTRASPLLHSSRAKQVQAFKNQKYCVDITFKISKNVEKETLFLIDNTY